MMNSKKQLFRLDNVQIPDSFEGITLDIILKSFKINSPIISNPHDLSFCTCNPRCECDQDCPDYMNCDIDCDAFRPCSLHEYCRSYE